MRKQIVLAVDDPALIYNFFVVDSIHDVKTNILGNNGIEYRTSDNVPHFYASNDRISPDDAILMTHDTAQCILEYCHQCDLFPRSGYMVTLGCIHTDNILGILSL